MEVSVLRLSESKMVTKFLLVQYVCCCPCCCLHQKLAQNLQLDFVWICLNHTKSYSLWRPSIVGHNSGVDLSWKKCWVLEKTVGNKRWYFWSNALQNSALNFPCVLFSLIKVLLYKSFLVPQKTLTIKSIFAVKFLFSIKKIVITSMF